LSNSDLLERILKSPRLPSLPTIALEVIDLVQQQDVNIKQIAETIQHDPALSSKILKTVNSSFYAQAHSIGTISHALVVLGLNSVKTLALGFSLVTNLAKPDEDAFDHMGLWKRSLFTATAAKAIAQSVGVVQQEEAFLGGLLQDLGMLAMHQVLGPAYEQVIKQAGDTHRPLAAAEQEALQLDHCLVGGELAAAWKLPPLLAEPIRYHHAPDKAPEAMQQIVRCVAVGNEVAGVFCDPEDCSGQSLEGYLQLMESWFAKDREAAEPLLSTIHKQTKEMQRLFELNTGDLGEPGAILAKANDAMVELSLQSQQEHHQLEQQNRKLEDEANHDALTGAANRRRLDAVLAQAFHEATADRPLSLLFLDADHFKQFNDSHGHPTGDRVLVKLAETLSTCCPEPALVGRYGGEEFALVLPNTDRPSAARIAECVRVAISEADVFNDEQQALRITASIGVACHDGTVFRRLEQFVRAADQGVYAAKAAGRNAVRVFTPRPRPAKAA
jgi:diguanylate cyclase (GGDEF)-like protein